MPIPRENISIETISAKEMVYRQMKDWIIEGVLQPGEKLSDRDISNFFNLSKTPVREAFKLLEAQRLIKTYPRSATVVTELDSEKMDEWYLPIIALESLAAALVSKCITAEQIYQLEYLDGKIYEAGQQGDHLGKMKRDKAFHDLIVEIAGNRYIIEFLDMLQNYIQRFEYIFFKEGREKHEYGRHHREIIQALWNHDEEMAATLMKMHWEHAMKGLKEMMKNNIQKV